VNWTVQTTLYNLQHTSARAKARCVWSPGVSGGIIIPTGRGGPGLAQNSSPQNRFLLQRRASELHRRLQFETTAPAFAAGHRKQLARTPLQSHAKPVNLASAIADAPDTDASVDGLAWLCSGCPGELVSMASGERCAVGFKLEPAVEFAGAGAVRGRRFEERSF